ncbi:Transcriptional regulator, LysR family [Nostocoides japonicum T1-X7]|uniref:Transcriptional regulator, LysR family n=1 Tax=Nostocoides japonicum T1-X7 TaxID=1194083 RepID=A0A077M651_9MICO|nr:LysR family transcriptional regulator [Tetrasphaera japonica]CCH79520.1 Transcriptional regulator, LysR family [Tetrasphaera japonica T1-X7]
MVTLHQFRCFLATVEHGSFTRAAESLGLAQPSLSQQIHLLERGLSTTLFHRVGRGVVATEAAMALVPHAQEALDAVDRGSRAVADVDYAVTGIIRFGLFGAAHLYLAAQLVADVRQRFPSARLALVGQNSTEVIEAVRRGQLEAALVALPVDDQALRIVPVARDEIVYVSADPDRARQAVSAATLAAAPLVLSEVTWGDNDYTRQQLKRRVQDAGGSLQPVVEVENVETALEVAALGLADAITARSIVGRQQRLLRTPLFSAPLRPRLFDQFAIVHRRGAALSRPARAVVELATARMREAVGE